MANTKIRDKVIEGALLAKDFIKELSITPNFRLIVEVVNNILQHTATIEEQDNKLSELTPPLTSDEEKGIEIVKILREMEEAKDE